MSQASVAQRMQAGLIKPLVSGAVGAIAGRMTINQALPTVLENVPVLGGQLGKLSPAKLGFVLAAAASFAAETSSAIAGIGIPAFRTTQYTPMFVHMGVGGAAWVLGARTIGTKDTSSARDKLFATGAAVEIASMYLYETALHDGLFDAFLGLSPAEQMGGDGSF